MKQKIVFVVSIDIKTKREIPGRFKRNDPIIAGSKKYDDYDECLAQCNQPNLKEQPNKEIIKL